MKGLTRKGMELMVLVVVSAMVFSGSAFGIGKLPDGSDAIFTCKTASIAPTIDGNPSDACWKTALAEGLDAPIGNVAEKIEAWKNFKEFEGWFVTCWKGTNFYILSEFYDDEIDLSGQTFNVDSLDIIIAKPHDAPMPDLDWLWGYPVGKTTFRDGLGAAPVEDMTVAWGAVDKKGKTWQVFEAVFDLSSKKKNQGPMPKPGEKIGFYLHYNDAEGGVRKYMMASSHIWNDLGAIIMSAEVLAVQAEGKLATTWGSIRSQ